MKSRIAPRIFAVVLMIALVVSGLLIGTKAGPAEWLILVLSLILAYLICGVIHHFTRGDLPDDTKVLDVTENETVTLAHHNPLDDEKPRYGERV